MPNMAPDVRYAVCLFDLSDGPVRLRARIPNELWLIAFYTPLGENFYTVIGADMNRADVDLIVTEKDQPVPDVGVDSTETFDNVVVVSSPVTKGVALIRAPLAGPSRSAEAERALKATYCGRPAARRGTPPRTAPAREFRSGRRRRRLECCPAGPDDPR